MNSALFQTLETRMMLSATHVGEMHDGEGSKLAADQLQYKTDVLKLASDRKLRDTTLAGDHAKVEADRKAIDAAKKCAKSKLEGDTKKMNAELALDSAASKKVRDVWMPIITADLAKIKTDGEHGEHLTEHKAKYESDMNSFRTAMAPCEAETKADIAKWSEVLVADKAGCESAGKSLTETLNSDLLKLKTDEQHFKEVISADEAKVKSDLEQIKKDTAPTPKK